MTACENDGDDGKIKVVCTVFPTFDWTREIVGENGDISIDYLLDSGLDMHSYDPTVSDISAITKCDLFIYIGGESEEWAEKLLSSHPNKNRTEIKLLDVLGTKALLEETTDSMEDDGEEEPETDEHVWLSVRNAQLFCACICEKLCALDDGNAAAYRENVKKYNENLSALDKDFLSFLTDRSDKKPLLFADRFPFLYLMKDYNLTYDAAFAGCSSSSEITPKTMVSLAKTVDKNDLSYVFILDGSKENNAKDVIARTEKKNQKILVIDSLQTVSSTNASSSSYYEAMKNNFDKLKTALS